MVINKGLIQTFLACIGFHTPAAALTASFRLLLMMQEFRIIFSLQHLFCEFWLKHIDLTLVGQSCQ